LIDVNWCGTAVSGAQPNPSGIAFHFTSASRTDSLFSRSMDVPTRHAATGQDTAMALRKPRPTMVEVLPACGAPGRHGSHGRPGLGRVRIEIRDGYEEAFLRRTGHRCAGKDRCWHFDAGAVPRSCISSVGATWISAGWMAPAPGTGAIARWQCRSRQERARALPDNRGRTLVARAGRRACSHSTAAEGPCAQRAASRLQAADSCGCGIPHYRPPQTGRRPQPCLVRRMAGRGQSATRAAQFSIAASSRRQQPTGRYRQR